MTNYYRFIIIFIAIASLKLKNSKDTTAQGVAKVRHCESILEDVSQRLYEDPYAHRMYFGSTVQTWMGGNKTKAMFDWFLKGMYDQLTLRTKWIDDQIIAAVSDERTDDNSGLTTTTTTKAEQLVILGAGYDTRGFRLNLPKGFVVLEVDQPGVQSSKRKILNSIAKTDTTVASRLNPTTTSNGPIVQFASIDFNHDSIRKETILDSTSLDSTKTTIVTLEGVTQYIPETSTASTLVKIHELFPAGSVLLISYVPDSLYKNSKQKPKNLSRLLAAVELVGEPWITSWSPESFASFLEDCGYRVISDEGMVELNEKYLVPRNRGLDQGEVPAIERFVVASIVK